MGVPVVYVYYVANAESRHPTSYARLRSEDVSVLGSIDRDMVAGPIKVEISDEDPIAWCEWVFAGMNHGSGREFPDVRNLRSMSVGDAIYITLDGESMGTWYCRPTGWLHVPKHVPSTLMRLHK